MSHRRVNVSWNLLAALLILALAAMPLLPGGRWGGVVLAEMPVISGVQAVGVSETNAVITWNTSISATSNVDYGTAQGGPYGSSPDDTTPDKTTHLVTLTGLDPNTTYYYVVRSSDSTHEATSSEYTFTTKAFTISDVTASSITDSSATVSWITTLGGSSVSTTSNVHYGKTVALGSSAPQPVDASADQSSHVVVLSGLEAATTYYYRVVCENASADTELSAIFTFTTGADVTAPAISSVSYGSVSENAATITWDTNESATSQVVYGTASVADDAGWGSIADVIADYEASTAEDVNLVGSHNVVLSGLSADQTYYFRVLSKDGSGNESWSAEASFTTGTDNTAPVISAVSSSGMTASGATLTWDTNEAATSQVAYATASIADAGWASAAQVLAAYGSSSPENLVLTGSHSVSLSGLDASQTYYYRVLSRDVAGNWVWSDEYSFDTLADTTAPAISSVSTAGLTDTGVVIGWCTDEPATSQVVYGTSSASDAGWTSFANATAAYSFSSPESAILVTSHGVMLAGLTPNVLYYYRVLSKDAAGNETWSTEYSFTTAADSTKPVITGVGSSGITHQSAEIEWDTDEPATSLVVYGTVSQPGPFADLAALLAAYDSDSGEDVTLVVLGHNVSLAGLLSNTTYYYRVISADAVGNTQWSSEYSFMTTLDTTPPSISSVTVTNIGETTATIGWDTDKLSTTQVAYSTTSATDPGWTSIAQVLAAYEFNTAEDATLVGIHSATLTGLSPNTKYYYRVVSKDAAGNVQWSAEGEFTTSGDVTPPPAPALDSPADGVIITTTTPLLQWKTVIDPSGVTYEVQLASNSTFATLVANPTNLTAAAGASYATFTSGSALDDGTYYWRVRAIDGAGNESNWSSARSFTVDTTAPTITLDNLPYHPATGPTPTFTGTASDTATRITAVQYRVLLKSDNTVIIDWTAADAADGAFSSLSEDFTMTTSALPEGWYLLEIKAFDQAGYMGTATYNGSQGFLVTTKPLVRLDASSPMTVDSPAWVTDDWRTKDNTPTFKGDATSTVSTIAKVQCRIDDGSWQDATITATSNGGAGATWEFTTATLADGAHTIQVKALDTLGYESPAEVYGDGGAGYLTFTIDTTPPTISDVRASNIKPNSVTITWTTNEPSTSQVEYGVDSDYGALSDADTELKTEHSIVLTGLKFKTTYHFRVVSADDVGNLEVSPDGTFSTPLPVWVYAVAAVGGLVVLGLVVWVVFWLIRKPSK